MIEAIVVIVLMILIGVVSYITGSNAAKRKAIINAQKIVEDVERKSSLLDASAEEKIIEINKQLTNDLALTWKEKVKKFVRP